MLRKNVVIIRQGKCTDGAIFWFSSKTESKHKKYNYSIGIMFIYLKYLVFKYFLWFKTTVSLSFMVFIIEYDWHITLISGVQHNDSIIVYIVKWLS